MQSSAQSSSEILHRLEDAPPLGLNALADRLFRIQSALSIVLSRQCSQRRLEDLVQTTRAASGYARVALENLRGARLPELPSAVVEQWLLRLLAVADEPFRVVAHGVSVHLHDLGVDNLARRLALRFVEPSVLGPPSPITGIGADQLLMAATHAGEQAAVADELQRVVELQEHLCAEAYIQYVA